MPHPHQPLTFGQWVKQQRKAAGLRQDDLAQKVACSLIMIKKIEADQRRPSRQIAELLAQRLHIPSDQQEEFLLLARSVQTSPLAPGFSPPSTNLPMPLSSLIGRDTDLQQLSALLRRSEVRLLTLTGPGGIGKTRLGIQAASDLYDLFADGVRFVPLEAIHDPDLVVPAISQALGVRRLAGMSPIEELIDYLRDKELLLFLDNFEQILPAALSLVTCLEALPDLKILTTSRSSLLVRGEQVFEVHPLALPNLLSLPSPAQLVKLPSVALFEERARVANPSFAISPKNAPAVAEICVRLDGLPLALELAAARCKTLTPQELLREIKGIGKTAPLDLLTSRMQDLPHRQQTLRRTIEWSYRLLPPVAQALFCQLGIFVGSFTLEAAESICDLSIIENKSHLALIDALPLLIDQHMLNQIDSSDGPPRFGMLELLREYALEQLGRMHQSDSLHRKHAEFYRQWMEEQAAVWLHTSSQVYWLDRIAAEYANLLAALDWSIEDPQSAETALRLAAQMWEFWLDRGYVREGYTWLNRVMALPHGKDYPVLHAHLLNGAGLLAWLLGYSQAEPLIEESLRLFKEQNHTYGIAWALNHLGQVEQSKGNLSRARELFEESERLFRRLGQTWNLAWVLYNLSQLYLPSNLNHTQQLLAEALALFRQAGEERGAAWALYQCAILARKRDNSEGALHMLEKCRLSFQENGDWRGYAWASCNLGIIHLTQRDFETAYANLQDSWHYLSHLNYSEGSGWVEYYLGRAAQATGRSAKAAACFNGCLKGFFHQKDRWGASWALVGCASIAQETGQTEQAVYWLASARSLQKSFEDQPVIDGNGEYQADTEAAARRELDAQMFIQAWRQGTTLPEQSIQLAIASGPE